MKALFVLGGVTVWAIGGAAFVSLFEGAGVIIDGYYLVAAGVLSATVIPAGAWAMIVMVRKSNRGEDDA